MPPCRLPSPQSSRCARKSDEASLQNFSAVRKYCVPFKFSVPFKRLIDPKVVFQSPLGCFKALWAESSACAGGRAMRRWVGASWFERDVSLSATSSPATKCTGWAAVRMSTDTRRNHSHRSGPGGELHLDGQVGLAASLVTRVHCIRRHMCALHRRCGCVYLIRVRGLPDWRPCSCSRRVRTAVQHCCHRRVPCLHSTELGVQSQSCRSM